MPIIGEGDEEPNDTYVEQLVAGAQAAVDEWSDVGWPTVSAWRSAATATARS